MLLKTSLYALLRWLLIVIGFSVMKRHVLTVPRKIGKQIPSSLRNAHLISLFTESWTPHGGHGGTL
ncbi:hypothetical protein V2K17_03945 [Pseudomonas alliivorans]|nr:hypothetical protein [Pseudomonas alliivorans]